MSKVSCRADPDAGRQERIGADREANQRTPQLLTVGIWTSSAGGAWGPGVDSASRSTALRRPLSAPMAADALMLVIYPLVLGMCPHPHLSALK